MRTTDGTGRQETAEERADRRWTDLLQELRVAQTGVQILFGFLLTVVFQQRFTQLSGTDRHLYVVTVVLGAATTGALVGPAAMHRVLTGRRLKPATVVWASRLTVLGLVLLLCTMAFSLVLVLRLAVRDTVAEWLAGGMVAWFALCWFVLPLWARLAVREEAEDGRDASPRSGPGEGGRPGRVRPRGSGRPGPRAARVRVPANRLRRGAARRRTDRVPR